MTPNGSGFWGSSAMAGRPLRAGLSCTEPAGGFGPGGRPSLAQGFGTPRTRSRFSPKPARYAVAPAGALLIGLRGWRTVSAGAPAHVPV